MGKVSNIVISGLTAAGKTTHAKLLCEEYGIQYVSASQILLKLAGLQPEQPPDFWVTPQGRELPRRISWVQIDNEFRRIESESEHVVFDCQSLPWLCSRESMCIWLDSSFETRLMKAIVSHKGGSNLTEQEVVRAVKAKDRFAQEQILSNYNINLLHNREPFDFIFDISTFITAATEEASAVSVARAHKIISNAVGWYLYNDKRCGDQFKESLESYGNSVIARCPQVR